MLPARTLPDGPRPPCGALATPPHIGFFSTYESPRRPGTHLKAHEPPSTFPSSFRPLSHGLQRGEHSNPPAENSAKLFGRKRERGEEDERSRKTPIWRLSVRGSFFYCQPVKLRVSRIFHASELSSCKILTNSYFLISKTI